MTVLEDNNSDAILVSPLKRPAMASTSRTTVEGTPTSAFQMLRLATSRARSNSVPPWPSPELSIGVSCTPLGKNKCWEVIGPALTASLDVLKSVKELLDLRAEYLHEKEPKTCFISFGIYMVGRDNLRANPTLLIGCERKPPRQKAVKLIRESPILQNVSGFRLADSTRLPLCLSLPVLLRPGSNLPPPGELDGVFADVLYSSPEGGRAGTCGIALYTKLDMEAGKIGYSGLSRIATAGGYVSLGGSVFGLSTLHNFVEDSSNHQIQVSHNVESEFEFDDELQEEEESNENEVDIEEGFAEHVSIAHNKILAATSAPDIDLTTMTPFGRIYASSFLKDNIGLDWVLIETASPPPTPTLNRLIFKGFPEKESINITKIVDEGPVENNILLISGISGILKGTISSSATFAMMPSCNHFVELWTVRLSEDVSQGDSGSWVINSETGDLYGHVVSGHPGYGIAYIMPAKNIAKDIESRFGSPLTISSIPSTILSLQESPEPITSAVSSPGYPDINESLRSIIFQLEHLYEDCGENFREFSDLRQDIRSLIAVMSHLKYEVEGPFSIPNWDRFAWGRQMGPVLEDLRFTIRQITSFLREYKSINISPLSPLLKMLSGKMMSTGSHELYGLRRLQLKSHETRLIGFLVTVRLHQPRQPEEALIGQDGTLDNILDKVDLIVASLRLEVYSANDGDSFLWKRLRRQLGADGSSSHILQNHKDIIRVYFQQMVRTRQDLLTPTPHPIKVSNPRRLGPSKTYLGEGDESEGSGDDHKSIPMWQLEEKETQKIFRLKSSRNATSNLVLKADDTETFEAIAHNLQALKGAFTGYRYDDWSEKVIEWYSAVDSSSNHLAACKKREPTTGEWFLTCPEFTRWLVSPRSFLWLHGIPGCGKTVLSSTIIERVFHNYKNAPRCAIAYFYFDFAETKKQSIKNCLSSLIAQICRQRGDIPEEIRSLCDRYKFSAIQPSITDLLVNISTAANGLDVILILDALDECAERVYLVDVLSTLSSESRCNVKILATSRPERDIELAILPLSTENVSIQDVLIQPDIRLFVVNSIESGSKMKWWPRLVKTEVEHALVQGAKGMFRWVICQLDVLRNCTTVQDVKKSLATLPPTLVESYERSLLNIDRAEWGKVRNALQWLIYSERPLRLSEIAEAVVIDPGAESSGPEDRLLEILDIARMCRSLVSLSDDTSELRLAHFSVQEYLLSDQIRHGPASFFSLSEVPAQVLIAEVCLTYLLVFDQPDSLSENSFTKWPLLDYACRHWFLHTRKLEGLPDRHNVTRMVNRLLAPHSHAFFNWLRIFEADRPWIRSDISKDASLFASPLYYAAFCGNLDAVRYLVEDGADVTARGGHYTNPLIAAAFANCDPVARLLIENNAEVDNIDRRGWKAIQYATINNNANLVKLLLESGADIESRDLVGNTPMHIAAHAGHMDTARVLVECHADVNIRSILTLHDFEPGSIFDRPWITGRTPLMEAASSGQDDMVHLLLDNGADINAVDSHGITPLMRAARSGHEKVFKILLERGADALVRNNKGRTANDWILK